MIEDVLFNRILWKELHPTGEHSVMIWVCEALKSIHAFKVKLSESRSPPSEKLECIFSETLEYATKTSQILTM